MKGRYNSYSNFLKEKFGCRVHKVSVDMGFTCPNRDGSVAIGGCVYCNNDSFVPPYARSRFSMHTQIKNGMNYLKKRFKAEKFMVYFQAYTNTYDDAEKLEKLYREALIYENVIGIVVGTRSDCIDREKLALLEELARECFVSLEYGIESIYDRTLEYMNRGHDYKSVVEAIDLTKNRGIYIGAHIIVGMPTETEEEMLQMAEEVSRLGIDSLKIHNLHLVRNTPLARSYKKTPFHLFTYDEYIDFVIRFLERISPEVVIERLFTDTPRDLLIAPLWNKTHNEIINGIREELERRNTFQGRLFKIN
ncbi:TIGR01212 family radical SAM protein [Desulfobacterota bacterium AH_259_B03_O07]|nr:TIGR01212 family radical SAM protein [Desulfobacterota bacterium AH_259_B03_O07]